MCLPSFPPVERYAWLRLPSSGSLGSQFPTFPTSITLSRSPVLCSAATANNPSRIASLLARSPIPLGLPFRLCPTLKWLTDNGRSSPISAGSLGHPVLLIFRNLPSRRLLALSSPRVTPMNTCPVPRPRWCPLNSPYRLQDCCLPVTPNRRLSPLVSQRLSILSTTIPISGFNNTACTLVPSSFTHLIAEIACGLHLWSAG